jgi:hypothetical protein
MNRTVVEEVQVEVFKPKTHFEELDERHASTVKGNRGVADVEDYEYYSEDDER